MSFELAAGVYVLVHLMGVYLLRASGTWRVLFTPVFDLAPDKTPDPLRVAPKGWIENHSFWDMVPDEAEDQTEEQVFWGGRQRKTG